MIRTLLFLTLLSGTLSSTMEAQLEAGSIAPDFTATAIDGNVYNLYDILAEGKTVFLDIAATWCAPCWRYHMEGTLKDLMRELGPEGTDEVVVFMIEGDLSTNLADLEGTGTLTLGDWITGTNYPIIESAGINLMYDVRVYPTVLMVCPDRLITRVGQQDLPTMISTVGECPSMDIAPQAEFSANHYDVCDAFEVQFTDLSWPRPDSWLWEFGDGSVSMEPDPVHVYEGPGVYDVQLTVTNAFGESEVIREQIVTIEEGYTQTNQRTAKTDTLGGGGFFEGGHLGMIFDAHQDMVLASAVAYSDKAEWRTFVVLDSIDSLIVRRDLFIPEGQHTLPLDMRIPAGEDYRLTLWSDAFLYRNNEGVDYPFVVDDLVTIKTSSANSNTDQFYYYLYDWKVRGTSCEALPSSVTDSDDEASVYPSPAHDIVTVESESEQLHTAQVLDLSGKVIPVGKHYVPGRLSLSVSNLEPGMYLIQYDTVRLKFLKI